MGKTLVSVQTIRELVRNGKKSLEVSEGTLITSLAAELAGSKGIQIVSGKKREIKPSSQSSPAKASVGPSSPIERHIVAIGSDHGGFQYKGVLKKFVEELGYNVLDIGTFSEDPCDYPDFAYAVAAKVSAGEVWRGIVIDGAGIGSCVVANKVKGVRAACCHNEFVARNAREHNDTNLLTLGSKVVGIEVCKGICRVWLETWFAGGRHAKRVDKIMDVETRFFR